MSIEQKNILIRIIISAVLTAVLSFISVKDPLVKLLLFLVPYLIIGYEALKEAFEGIREGEIFDEDFLMAVATIGAMALGEFREAVTVMLLFQLGEFFEDFAVEKSRKNISDLMDIRPDVAYVESGSMAGSESPEGTACSIVPTDPAEVPVGSIIAVRKGEKIPIDGIIIDGSSSLDTASLTGESRLRQVGIGDSALSGCINMGDTLRIRTTALFGESTASKILDLVENAASRKSSSENFISRFARIYTPAVCLCALLIAVIPPVIRLLSGTDMLWHTWIYRALTFLVISCPCALVISIPLTFFAGIGGAGKAGVLIKGSNFLENLSKIKAIAFDKTGTLTNPVSEASQSPAKILTEEPQDAGKTAEIMSELPYSIKPTAKKTVAGLKKLGIRNIVILSGDKKEIVEAVAKEIGITEYYSELLPEDKVTEVEKLLSKYKTAFAGDGINDAPVLARADIGIAMGVLGTDAAIEAADVVLMDDDPSKILKAVSVSKKCMRIVYENIAFAIGIKVLCLILGALGFAGMWMAVFADVGVMIIAVLNALRALLS